MDDSVEVKSISQHELTKTENLLLVIITIIVAAVGTILYSAGFNNSFVSTNEIYRIVMDFISSLGSQIFIILYFCFFYFIFDKEFSRRLINVFLLSHFTNTLIKNIFQDPRPPTNCLDLQYCETSYGFPSAHSQNAIAFFGYIYLEMQDHKEHRSQKLIQAYTIFCMMLIPFSRLVIGVHDVDDVFGGAVIGLIYLLLFYIIEPKFGKFIGVKPVVQQIIISVVGAIVVFITILFAFPEEAPDFAIVGGILLGVAIAFPLEDKYVNYNPRILKGNQKIVIFIIGTLITFITYFLSGQIFESILIIPYIKNIIQFFLVTFVIVFLCPWIFTRILKTKKNTT